MTPDAAEVARVLWAGDRASQGLGMTIDEIGEGRAQLSMTVREDMTNGHDICHGGFLFALADSAFAFACNSANLVAVASSAHIEFVAPANIGERLTATATQVWTGGRAGLTDVDVTGPDGRLVARFHGRSSRTGGTIIS